MRPSSDIQLIIDRVEDGRFDDLLGVLEGTSLGIYFRAQAQNGEVISIPQGYWQSENGLNIEVTNMPTEGTTRVGWYGRADDSCYSHCHSHCTTHNEVPYETKPEEISPDTLGVIRRDLESMRCYMHCRGQHNAPAGRGLGAEAKGEPECTGQHCYGHCTSHNHVTMDDDPLVTATELRPLAVEARLYAMCRDGTLSLDELATHGIGIALIHGHSSRYEFTELPLGMIAVIENAKTHFRQRSDIVDVSGLVPNVWRFENGIRHVAGGFM